MHALILAAGQGSRLATAMPKCLVQVARRPLLAHQIEAVKRAGATRITIVVGHGHEQVRSFAEGEATFVHNDRFAETNSLYSFWLARHAVAGDLLVMNCDVLFPEHVLQALLEPDGSTLVFDSNSGDDEEHMKVRIRDGHLVGMSKKLPPSRSDGENLGILRLTEEAAEAAFDAAGALVGQGREQDWLGTAINAIACDHPIACVDVAGLPWVEIDFPRDLASARTEIWPAIQALARPVRRPHVGRGFGWRPAIASFDVAEVAAG